MSQQLARRTGTVGALAVLAGITSVAGVWPVLGTASAAELRPGRVHAAAEKLGKESAPGQVQKAEPAPEPESTVAGEADPTTAEGEVTAAAPRETKETNGPGQDSAEQEAMTGPPTGVSGAQAGPKAADPVPGPEGTAAEPPTATEQAPVASSPAGGPKPERKPRQAPRAVATPAEVAPASSGRGVLAAAPRSARTPRQSSPATARPASGTVSSPVVGPVVPPRAPVLARSSRSIPLSISPARSAAVVSLQPVAAADAVPLRPAGAQPLAAPRRLPGADPLAISLTTLPGFAAGTAEAVARRPELPLGLAAVVVVFLLLQSRIDRRDPKLALAPIEEDEGLEFREVRPVGVRLLAV